MQLDHTALYQVAMILALWVILKRLVFDRILENLERRRRATSGALDEARKLRDEAAELKASHEAAVAEFRRQAQIEREALRRQGETEERELVERARTEAGRALEAVREQTRREVEGARAELERDAADLAERAVASLLGRSVR